MTPPSTPPTAAQQQLVSDTLGVYSTPPSSRCSAVAQALLTTLAESFQDGNTQNHSAQVAAGGAPQKPDDPDSHSLKSSSDNLSQLSLNSTRNKALSAIQFFSQPGYVDFGLAGTPVTVEGNSTAGQPSRATSCEPSCSYTNPSAAYGVTVLPLHPSEDLQAKVSDPLTPRHEAQNLDGRYGPRRAPSWQLNQDEVVVLAGCIPPAEASR